MLSNDTLDDFLVLNTDIIPLQDFNPKGNVYFGGRQKQIDQIYNLENSILSMLKLHHVYLEIKIEKRVTRVYLIY